MKRCSTSFMIKLHWDIIFHLSDGPNFQRFANVWQDCGGIGRDSPTRLVGVQTGQPYRWWSGIFNWKKEERKERGRKKGSEGGQKRKYVCSGVGQICIQISALPLFSRLTLGSYSPCLCLCLLTYQGTSNGTSHIECYRDGANIILLLLLSSSSFNVPATGWSHTDGFCPFHVLHFFSVKWFTESATQLDWYKQWLSLHFPFHRLNTFSGIGKHVLLDPEPDIGCGRSDLHT